MRDDFTFPMSFAQQRLWFLDRLAPHNSSYHISRAFRLTGALESKVLEASLKLIVSRHDSLRTRFEMIDGQPVQIIAPSMVLPFKVIDLSDLSVGERDGEVNRLLVEESGRPFNLGRGPLLRIMLLRLGAQEHVLLLAMHHIVSDDWSLGVMERELSALYEAAIAERSSQLQELPMQYADYAVWQHERLQGDVLEQQLEYWRKHLSGIQELMLPTDRPRPVDQSFRGARYQFEVPTELTSALKDLAGREGVTLFIALLAVFQVLLARYSGQDDVAVSSPIAGRNKLQLEGLIGFFVNTLVLRTDLSGDPGFIQLLGRVRDVCLDAYEYQDLPFEKLIEELKPERDPSRNPLVQVMFVLQNAPHEELQLKGLNVEPIDVDIGAASFDLVLNLTEKEGAIHGLVSYSTDLFDAGTIARLGGHFNTLLNGIIADPRQRISALPLLTDYELHQLLVDWNDTASSYPKDLCIHQLFEKQAAQQPDAVAVVFEDQRLTYGELNICANQLAHYLQSIDVCPESLVGIYVERSIEMVVGILGILKAGGVYVPLDPNYPKDRLAFMIDDACISILLTQERLLSSLPSLHAKTVCLDNVPEVVTRQRTTNPDAETNAENLAYVIYTSGSTGVPKGVAVSHRGMCNYLFWRAGYMQLNYTDRLLQKTSLSFDVSVWEIFEPLMAGAQIILARPDGQQDSAYLAHLIAKHEISAVSFAPSMLKVFLEEAPVERCNSLRRVNVGGEVLSCAVQDLFFKQLPGVQLYNGYGPTEATIGTVYWHCRSNGRHNTVPIGRPIANTQIYILDSQLNPMPIGVSGELCIGGDGLARGYLNRPELTAEKFIRNPFSEDPEARIYKTGDLARYLPDGNIEFIGRIDHQVKLRGFRIELGEIEAVLGECPDVKQAVVTVREDKPGNKQLVAYIVAQDGCEFSAAALRSYLKQRLPQYMIPSVYINLDALPLTPNGKVDRNSLPVPVIEQGDSEEVFTAPRTPMEKAIADIWQEVLGIEQVAIHDDFFYLGGHSLHATRIASRISKLLEVEIQVRSLFEFRTIAELATMIESTYFHPAHNSG